MTQTPSPATRRAHVGRHLTVQGWQNLVLFAIGAVVLAGAITGAVLLNRTDDGSHELVEVIQPARIAAYQLQAALRDQETAIRGYAIAADPQFLEPYYEGQQVEAEAVDEIRMREADRPDLLADLDAIERAADNWRTTYAEPLIAGVTPGAPNLADLDAAQLGKVEFDRMRALFDTQNEHLTQEREKGVAELQYVRDWRDRVLALMVVAFFIAAILVAVVVRKAVVRPLNQLAAACRRITEGNFDERITPRGPKDIRAIAVDVEDMRQRMVEELESSKAGRAQLALQAEELDEQAEELRRSNAELEQFAYVASHDLQEPLRKVASFCQLLEKRYGDQLDERGAEYIGFAVDGAKRMQVLINDLLTFSRVGRLNATLDDVDLERALDDAVKNLATAVEESGAEIVRPEQPMPHIAGDPTLLIMLWQNLIGNAVKFRHNDRTPRIVIEYEHGTGDHENQWLFSVSDNGIGIGEEFVDKVFVIFQRLHGRDAYSGTGIGLALCRKIVEHHGGLIWIDTTYDQGTRFNFTLPIAVGETPAATLEGTPQ